MEGRLRDIKEHGSFPELCAVTYEQKREFIPRAGICSRILDQGLIWFACRKFTQYSVERKGCRRAKDARQGDQYGLITVVQVREDENPRPEGTRKERMWVNLSDKWKTYKDFNSHAHMKGSYILICNFIYIYNIYVFILLYNFILL